MSADLPIIIDPRIQSHIPPLRPDELALLEEAIVREGCRDPLVVWEQENILLDGHNRYDICARNDLEFYTETVALPDFDAALAWVEENQLGRRNLTADQFAYFMGRKYEREKKDEGAPGGNANATKQLGNFFPVDSSGGGGITADRIGSEYGVTGRTVKNAADFARNVDSIATQLGDQARSEILAGQPGVTRVDVADAAQKLPTALAGGLTFASTKDVFKWVKDQREEKAKERQETRLATLATDIPEGRWPILLIDPPWRYENAPAGGANREVENQYPTMTLEEICAVPVAEMASDDAILYMWTTAPKLEESFAVLEAWGFSYRTNLVWVKDRIGMGYHARSQHEHVLIAKRGEFPPPLPEQRDSSVIFSDRTEHSRKPTELHERLERYYPTLRKIELFARSPRDGWDAWGNQLAAVDADIETAK